MGGVPSLLYPYSSNPTPPRASRSEANIKTQFGVSTGSVFLIINVPNTQVSKTLKQSKIKKIGPRGPQHGHRF